MRACERARAGPAFSLRDVAEPCVITTRSIYRSLIVSVLKPQIDGVKQNRVLHLVKYLNICLLSRFKRYSVQDSLFIYFLIFLNS